MRLIATLICALALSGCAHEYAAYAEAHKAQAAAQTARYQALADIAKQGDTTAKVAAVMSLQMGGGQQNTQIAAPKNWADYALQWTGLLLPTVGQIYTVNKQTSLGMRQSDNATALGHQHQQRLRRHGLADSSASSQRDNHRRKWCNRCRFILDWSEQWKQLW